MKLRDTADSARLWLRPFQGLLEDRSKIPNIGASASASKKVHMDNRPQRKRHAALAGAVIAAFVMGIGPTYSRDDAGAVPAAGDDSSPDALQTLEKRRDQNRQDLEELVDSIGLSEDKTRKLEESIASLNQDSARIREELIASAARRNGDLHGTWVHLERAHILSQPAAWLHTRVHLAMLMQAVRNRDLLEIGGQFVRIAVAGIGSALRSFPAGNTGRASMPLTQPMPIPEDLASLLESAST